MKEHINSKGVILVLDSGIGGLSILNSLLSYLPHENFIYIADYEFLPYGEKSADEIKHRCVKIIDYLSRLHEIKAVVLACNSATAASISFLRESYPLLFFGTEPGIKPASKRSKKAIAVLATELTLHSESFKRLISSYAQDKPVYTLPAPELVYLVEEYWTSDNRAKRIQKLQQVMSSFTEPFDALLLGCTHFNFLKDELEQLLGSDVSIIDTSEAIASWVAEKLDRDDLLGMQESAECLVIYVTGENPENKKPKILSFLDSGFPRELVYVSNLNIL